MAQNLRTWEASDFGEGLVTAVDESLLKPNQSPALSNVDITQTNAIVRRDGYGLFTGTALPAHDVNGMMRYYKVDGTKQFVVVCGTAVYTKNDNIIERALTRKELTSSNVTGTVTTIQGAAFSGGSCITVTGTSGVITATIPYSTNVTVGFGALVTASVRVDAGAWTNVAATYWSPTITASTHSLSVKAGSYNNKSGYLSTPAIAGGNVTITATSAWTASESVSFSFHDAGQTNIDFGVLFGALFIGVDRSLSTVFYSCGTNISRTARSNGWHVASAKFVSGRTWQVSLDGAVVGATQDLDQPQALKATVTNTSTTNNLAYFDSLILDGVLKEDFDGTTNWTKSGSAAGTIGVSTNTCVTGKKPCWVDYINSRASASFTNRHGAITATSAVVGMAQLNNITYIISPNDRLIKWDGTTLANVTATTPVLGSHLVTHQRRLFTAGAAADPALLQYSAIDEPENWVSGGAVRVAGKDAGAECTGLKTYQNKVLYFSKSQTYAVNIEGDTTAWYSTQVSDSIGCIAPKSIASAANGVIFLSADGVRSYGVIPQVSTTDGSGMTLLSKAITPTLDAFTDEEKALAVGCFFKGRYWLYIGGKIVIADLEKRTKDKQPPWLVYEYDGLTNITSMYRARGDEDALYAGSTSGVYRLSFGNSDNGSAIASSYKTAPLPVGGWIGIKHFRRLLLRADSSSTQSLVVTPVTDDVPGTTSTVTISPSSAVQPLRIPLNARGRYVQFTLASSGAEQPLSISSLALVFTPPRIR